MARIKLSEYRAKSLLVDGYRGVSLSLDSLASDIESLDENISYIVKVDQGIKKRGKQGLIRLNVSKKNAEVNVHELAIQGFNRFIAEPILDHDDSTEKYISFERTREGVVIHYSEHGGVDIEDNASSVQKFIFDNSSNEIPVERSFLSKVIQTMDIEQLSFVEINPLVIKNGKLYVLDAAVLADSAGMFASSWTEDDIVESETQTETETAISELNKNSPAAFSFKLLNADASIWLLLSGGGASITIADEAHNQGKSKLIGNYGEYSGGPSSEETYLYTSAALRQALHSSAPKKAIVIAGGVANFTDVKKTFSGIIRAFEEKKVELKAQNVRVFVRRGGPNEKEGLAMMKDYLKANNLFGSVDGSSEVLTDVVHKALEYVDA